MTKFRQKAIFVQINIYYERNYYHRSFICCNSSVEQPETVRCTICSGWPNARKYNCSTQHAATCSVQVQRWPWAGFCLRARRRRPPGPANQCVLWCRLHRGAAQKSWRAPRPPNCPRPWVKAFLWTTSQGPLATSRCRKWHAPKTSTP